MPFTTAHAALVMPLKKFWPQYFSLTGLMAGAMAPDLIYFLQLTTTSRGFSHSWPGLFLFCLPAGIAFSFAFHWLFKYHFIINLPSPLDKRLSGLAASSFTIVGFRSWLIFVISIILGAMSHFFWDSFTHPGGVIARAVPFLTEYTRIFGTWFLNASILQYLSTIGGTIGLAVGIWKGGLIPSPELDFLSRTQEVKLRFWVRSSTIALVFASATALIFWYFLPPQAIRLLAIFGISGWSGFFYVVAVYAVMAKARKIALVFLYSR